MNLLWPEEGKLNVLSCKGSLDMDASTLFRRTNFLCSLHGLSTNVSRKYRVLHYYKSIVITMVVLLSAFGLLRFILRVSMGKYSLTDIFRNILSIAIFKLLCDLERRCSWLDPSVDFMLKNVPEEHIKRLRKLDWLACLSLVAIEGSAFAVLLYTYATDQFSGIRIMVVGPEYHSSEEVMIVLIVQCSYYMGCVTLAAVLYIEMQLVTGLFCRSLDESLASERQIKIEQLIEQCRYINYVRHSINGSISFIPFALVLTIWFFFISGLSFIHTFDSIKNNKINLLLIISLMFEGQILLEVLVRSTTYFKRSADRFRESCAKLTSNPDFCDRTTQYRMANLLHNFLTTEKLPPMMAYDMIKISPNLSLSLLNSMITFTVMMLTSFRVYLK